MFHTLTILVAAVHTARTGNRKKLPFLTRFGYKAVEVPMIRFRNRWDSVATIPH
ncbi:hypothetical protein IV87_GL000136 [Pediococcus ethanolidurans]|uniref:Uncharacterized protein n=1 Tax=Pediococcus ethanolidurans TaxID=319653 RepID=A0A0R2K289_9LACO|nr:hypothetical protein IV87_GL000136 [Pediococcus ethanolidurans]